MRTVPTGPITGMLANAAAEVIDKNTICLVGIAGHTEYGMIDPIEALAKIVYQHDIFLHIDAAFGGMVIPFLEKPIPFDFALPGVTTIAVDPHKMGNEALFPQESCLPGNLICSIRLILIPLTSP